MAREDAAKNKARQIAIQGVYNALVLGNTPDDLPAFLNSLIASASHKAPIDVDREFALTLISGVFFRKDDLEQWIAAHSSTPQIGLLVKAILLCGAFELRVMEAPVKPALKAYLAQAELYFDAPERPFIHAVLDAIGKNARI